MKVIPKASTAVAAVARHAMSVRAGDYVVIDHDQVKVLSPEAFKQTYTTVTSLPTREPVPEPASTNSHRKGETFAVGRWVFHVPRMLNKSASLLKLHKNLTLPVIEYFATSQPDAAPVNIRTITENIHGKSNGTWDPAEYRARSEPIRTTVGKLVGLGVLDADLADPGDPLSAVFVRGKNFDKFFSFMNDASERHCF